MRVDNDARLFISWDATLTFDPAGTSVVLNIDGTPYTMTWQGVAVAVGATWTQTARTGVKFAGSTAPIAGTDVRLTAGRHTCEPVVTLGDGQIVPCYPTIPIDVS